MMGITSGYSAEKYVNSGTIRTWPLNPVAYEAGGDCSLKK